MGEREARAALGLRAAGLGIAVNLALAVLKGVVGVLGHSQALIADAVHSGGDLVNSGIAFVSFLFSRRPPDWNHPYGHERAEAFAATVGGVLIGVAGLVVGRDAVTVLLAPGHATPDLATLWAALAALIVKLALTRYVGDGARRTRSQSLKAETRDHLNDVVVSLVVIASIVVAQHGLWWVDPLASLCVAGFILVSAGMILRDAASELLDTSLSPDQRRAIQAIAIGTPGVRNVQAIAGRTIGHTILVELHVDVDPALTVAEGARVVDALKAGIRRQMSDVRTVVVELNTDQFEPDALRLMAPPGRSWP